MKRIVGLTVLFFLSTIGYGQKGNFAIIPEPVQLTAHNGVFRLSAATVIQTDNSELEKLGRQFAKWIAPATGWNLPVGKSAAKAPGVIVLKLSKAVKGLQHAEGYRLSVNPQKIVLEATTEAGIFYGLQTLRQLLPAPIEGIKKTDTDWEIPAVSITDYPRFGWRGLMLDVSRHFFPKEFVKEYIDQMARYKFNVLHWHLTDDQGWRIEIKAYPKLTEVGAWRVYRSGRWWTHEPPKKEEPASYGGFYTQEEIKEIVAYAKERHIDILPEIDVPGHSLAAIAAYPYLSATGYLTYVNPGSKFYNIEDNTLNPADERVYNFLDTVFAEVAALFPFDYIHVGGDECTKLFWSRSASVQSFMKEKGIKTEDELQSYFIKRMEKLLATKGKKLVGWDEILEGGLAEEATVMSWRGMAGGIDAAKMGRNVIMTPAEFAYLDLYQGDPVLEPDTYSMLTLKSSYNWNPVPDNVDDKLILGGQGNLWTESVPTGRHAEYMTWPRSFALAEVFWTPIHKMSWNHFQRKLPQHFQRFDHAGINYSRAAYDVRVTAKRGGDGRTLLAKLNVDIDGLDVYYTTDNTNPDLFSQKYTEEYIVIPPGIYHLRAQTYRNGAPVGQLLIIGRDEIEKRAPRKKD